MMLRRWLVLAASLSASFLVPGCKELLDLCDGDREGNENKACFARTCGKDDCDPGPVLAGGEFEVKATAEDDELEGVDYESVGFVTFQGGAEVLDSQTQCLCDVLADSCTTADTDCTWTGRFRAPDAGDLRIALQTPDGTRYDEYDVSAVEASSVRVAVVKADHFDLTAPGVTQQTLTPDAAGVVEVDAGDEYLFLIAAGLDRNGRELTTVGGGFAHVFDKKAGVVSDGGRSGPGERIEAKKAGETTVTVSALVGSAQAAVRIRVR